MQKLSQCSCGFQVRIPNAECLYQCRKCHKKGIFLCHIIENTEDLMHLRCKPCKNVFSMFDCPQCQGRAVIKSFNSGYVYGCVCGFQGTFVTCNTCTSLLCLPAKKNYQNQAIKCQKCSNTFKFTICKACQQCNYYQIGKQIRPNQCFNEECQRFVSKNSNIAVNVPNSNLKPLYPEVQSKQASQPQSDRCNICYNSASNMVNTTCFHMSCCEPCSKGLNGVCQMCRAVGQYRKVFKS